MFKKTNLTTTKTLPRFVTQLILLLFCGNLLLAQDLSSYKIRKVVIDAGHGGKDPGASGKIAKEKNITLSLALKVGKYIEEKIPGVEVVYTRKTDVFVELIERAAIANRARANLFISIHVNSNPSNVATGTDSWVMGLHKNEENLAVAKLENKVILVENNYEAKYEGLDPNSTESYIIFNLMQNIFNDQSLTMASKVQDELRTRAGRKDRGVKTAPFVVLWKTTMPSVLIETGFISNAEEEKFLVSDEGQDFVASAIFRAFRDYKEKLDGETVKASVQDEIQQDSTADAEEEDISDESADSTMVAPHGGIIFSLQLLSSVKSVSLQSETFKDIKNVQEQHIDKVYKYTVGMDDDYDGILALKEKYKNRFPEAFVIASKDGKRIQLQDALKELAKNKQKSK